MSNSLARLFGYEKSSRSLSGVRADDDWIRREYNSFDGIRALLDNPVFRKAGLTEAQFSYELIQIIRQRLVALLMPEAVLFENPAKAKPIIRNHISSLMTSADEELVSALKFFANNFRNKLQKSRRKLSIEDVKLVFPLAFDKILSDQNGRCKTCGTRLLYGSNMELDHIVPWHLGDDPSDGSNWQFLCGECNKGKSEWMHYTAQIGWIASINTRSDSQLSMAVRYAAMSRDRGCTNCKTSSGDAELVVSRRMPSGCWVFDNVVTLCRSCSPVVS
jgi:5-methylcytosine-specific restriction endonuclease McrA